MNNRFGSSNASASLQAHRLESIGGLTAGIAHEINTPIQYVNDNTRFLEQVWKDCALLFNLLHESTAGDLPSPSLLIRLREVMNQIDLEYLESEVPRAIEQSIAGLARVTHLLQAMKEFAHPGQGEKRPVDLGQLIENTIAIGRNEWKYVAEVQTDFDPSMSSIACDSGELMQCLLNLIINAAHAIEERLKIDARVKGLIGVRTIRQGEWAEIRIQDNGAGIPEELRQKVFEPFFTTKPPGRGTGQGLALVKAVICDRHGGSVDLQSMAGEGTTFVLRLPVA